MAGEFGHAGVLNEGELQPNPDVVQAVKLRRKWKLTSVLDGIHVDMDRLKKGEVK
jgi:hypothetical protein